MENLPCISLTRHLPEVSLSCLKDKCNIQKFPKDRPLLKNELLEFSKKSFGIISTLYDDIDKTFFESCKSLKIVANYAVGFNNIDLNEAKKRGIFVTNTPHVLTSATADLTMALLLSLARRITEADKFVREGRFDGWGPSLFLGKDLENLTLGIIGMGRIGEAVAIRAISFGMKIIFYNKGRKEGAPGRQVSLDEIIRESDILSIHCPLNNETHHLLNKERLSSLKKGVIIINTSRGAVIEESALLELLKNGHIYAAGLDVYENEPEIEPEFLSLSNVILLPHIGSAGEKTRYKMAEICALNILDCLEGKRPRNELQL